MFENSVMLTRFSAGSDINSIQSRIQRLESMIHAVDNRQRQQPVDGDADLMGRVSFKNYLGNTAAPPKVQPLNGSQKERFQSVQPLVEKYASQYQVDMDLVNAVIRQESGFNPNAVSSAGAQGLMQLMPTTAKGLGVQNAFDPEQNLAGGIKHLSGLLKKYHGNVALALAAYNAGGGAVDRHGGIPPYKETQNYVRKILAAYLNAKNPNT